MKYVFAAWALPIGLFWGWYFLSLNDINFGLLFFSRQVHDFVFALYGEMLGIAPQAIPGMVAEACVVDGMLLAAIWAFRRRREIAAWARSRLERHFPARAEEVQVSELPVAADPSV